MTKRFSARLTSRSAAVMSGVVAGLAAPSLFIAGTFEQPLRVPRTSVAASWMRVGSYLRQSMNDPAALDDSGETTV